jgi:integrase
MKFPVYPARPHKSGLARITIAGKDYYLGRHGSPASYAEYARLADLHARQQPIEPKLTQMSTRATVEGLVAAWLRADPRGADHQEVIAILRACVPLVRLFGQTRADEFTARRLSALQDAMATCSWMTPEERERLGDWSRGYVNAQLKRLLRVFRWGEAQGHCSPGTWEHLKTVPPLKANDRRVRTTAPVRPVEWEVVVRTLPFLSPVVAAMVTVQYHAAMRPQDVCTMHKSEIREDELPGVWTYRPGTHKNLHRGHLLVKVLGPKAQAALLPWYAVATGYIFPTHKKRYARGHYTVEGYGRAVTRACELAKVERWSPMQLRHAARLMATRAGGLDAARALLGHSSMSMSAHYAAGVDLATAAEVARKIG